MKSDEILAKLITDTIGLNCEVCQLCPLDVFTGCQYEDVDSDCGAALLDWARKKAAESETHSDDQDEIIGNGINHAYPLDTQNRR